MALGNFFCTRASQRTWRSLDHLARLDPGLRRGTIVSSNPFALHSPLLLLDLGPDPVKHEAMTSSPVDPLALFREFVTQWETLANDVGAKLLSSAESAQMMHGGAALSLKAQQMGQQAMEKGLAAANMPSKADVVALGERMLAIEGQLSRIEAMLAAGQSARATGPAPMPTPKRTKTPPPKAL
jgi:hypothetical protein